MPFDDDDMFQYQLRFCNILFNVHICTIVHMMYINLTPTISAVSSPPSLSLSQDRVACVLFMYCSFGQLSRFKEQFLVNYSYVHERKKPCMACYGNVIHQSNFAM
jgi:hypothetical protein